MKAGKGIIAVIQVSVLIFFLAACFSSMEYTPEMDETVGAPKKENSTTVTLRLMTFASLYKEGMKEVEKSLIADTGISLDITKVPDGEQGNVIFRIGFATKDLPDLEIYYANVGEYRKFGNPDEIFLDQTNSEWIKNFDKDTWKDQMALNDRFYVAPYAGSSVLGVMYNKKVFSKLGIMIPVDYTGFLNACEKIKAAGIVPFYISGKDSWTTMLLPWLAGTQNYTADFISDLNDNKVKFKDFTALKDGFDKLLEIKNKGYINKNYLTATNNDAQKALVDGTAAMYLNYSMVMDAMQTKFPSRITDISFFSFPFEGNGEDVVGVAPPYGIFGLKGKNDATIQRFIDYFESVPIQIKYFSAEGGIPSIKGVASSKYIPAVSDAKAYIDSGRANLIWSAGLAYGYGNVGALTLDLLMGSKKPEQILDLINDEFERNARNQRNPKFN